MAYTFNRDSGYSMPTGFGPARTQNVAHYGSVTQLIILYQTDKDALAALLPEPFEPADDPAVTVYCQVSREVDFMGGHGYNLVGVNLSAVFNGKKDRFTYPLNYAAVLWENDTFPIIQGREILGAPKIYADIPDPQQKGNNWSFHCSVYGKRLVEGEIKNATPLDDTARQQIEQMSGESLWAGWKYIPKTNGIGSEVSFPTVIPHKLTISKAWLGEGSHRFFESTWENVLTSAQVMQGLRTLVVKEYRSALIMKGTLDLLFGECRRIE
jgi:hypothetical protein